MDKTQIHVDALTQAAKKGAEFNITTRPDEDLIPTIILVTNKDVPTGAIEVYGFAAEKEQVPAMMLKALVERQAEAYALVVEAWASSFAEEAKKYNYKIRDMPEDDKYEIVNIFAVSRDKGCLSYSVSKIERLGTGERKLKGWEEGSPAGVSGPFVILNW